MRISDWSSDVCSSDLKWGKNPHGEARTGMVKWRYAAAFAVSGVIGATLSAQLGKAVDSVRLLTLCVNPSLQPVRDHSATTQVRLTRQVTKVILSHFLPMDYRMWLTPRFYEIGKT